MTVSARQSPRLPHPEQELLKARLTLQIYRIIKARRVTQTQAGEILGIRQPQVSLLMRNRSGNVSVERLMDFLTALGHDVEVRVTPTRKEHGQPVQCPQGVHQREPNTSGNMTTTSAAHTEYTGR